MSTCWRVRAVAGAWLYCKDMVGMQAFYDEVMGLPLVVDQGWAKVALTGSVRGL